MPDRSTERLASAVLAIHHLLVGTERSQEQRRRFAELFSGSPGDLWQNLVFKEVMFMALGADGHVTEAKKVEGEALVNIDRLTKEWSATYPDQQVEIFGASWDWYRYADFPPGSYSCLKSKGRPAEFGPVAISRALSEAEALIAIAEAVNLTEAQKRAIETYDGGAFAYLIDIPTRSEFAEALAQCGDTLFRYIVSDLGDLGADNPSEVAAQRLSRARESIDDVILALDGPSAGPSA